MGGNRSRKNQYKKTISHLATPLIKSHIPFVMNRETPVTSRTAATPGLALPQDPPRMTDVPQTNVVKAVPVGVTPMTKDAYAFLESTKPTKEIKRWSKEQDSLLTAAVKEFGEKNWKAIADRVPHRTDSQCLHRWTKVLNPW